jgi:hypothetical protein
MLILAICVATVGGAVSYWSFFTSNGYLPSPFVYDKTDTFMDFFHPMFWADSDGRYSEWGSVYPPLNFLVLDLLRWLAVGDERFLNAFALRENAVNLQIVLVTAYALVPAYVISRSYWSDFSVTERLMIYCIALTCTPMLFALERGNLAIFSLLLLPSVIYGKPVGRALAIALLVNLKPYFAVLYFLYIVRRSWQELAGALLAGGVLFLVTGLLVDREFFLFLENLLAFSRNESLFSLREVMSMPSSISAFSYVLGSMGPHQSGYIEALGDPIALAYFLEGIKWAVLLFALWAIISSQASTEDRQVVAVLGAIISNLGVSVGGYTLIFYLAFVPVFVEMRLGRTYLIIVAAMALPLDWLVLVKGLVGQQAIYLSGITKDIEWELGLGSIVRPVLNLLLLASLSWELMSDRRNAPGGICIQLPSAKSVVQKREGILNG